MEDIVPVSLEDGFTYRKSELARTGTPQVLYIPQFIILFGGLGRHTREDLARHANAEKKCDKSLCRWYWHDTLGDVAKLVKGCLICNRNTFMLLLKTAGV